MFLSGVFYRVQVGGRGSHAKAVLPNRVSPLHEGRGTGQVGGIGGTALEKTASLCHHRGSMSCVCLFCSLRGYPLEIYINQKCQAVN